jgi:hypothetical protein
MSDQDILTAFLFLGPPNLLAGLEIATAKHEGTIAEAALAIRANIESAVHVASIPYTMTMRAVEDQRFHSIFTAERIRALDEPIEAEQQALQKAKSRFDLELETLEGQKYLQIDVLGRLA